MRLHVSDPTSFESVELDAPPESCFNASRSSRFCVVNLYFVSTCHLYLIAAK